MEGITWVHRLAASQFHVANLARLTKRKVPVLAEIILSDWPKIPHNMRVVVLAWEIMTPEQCEEWLVAVEREV